MGADSAEIRQRDCPRFPHDALGPERIGHCLLPSAHDAAYGTEPVAAGAPGRLARRPSIGCRFKSGHCRKLRSPNNGIFAAAFRPGGRARRLSVGNWQLDPYHTQVEFSAKHLGMMTVRGYFDEVSTVGEIDPDKPEISSVEATISTASLRTNNGTRDNDIKSSNFLEVGTYPFIKFKSTSVEPSGQDHYKLTGDLTIKETTRPVVLDVVKYGEFNDPGMMGHRISYGATTKINRKEFGLSFNAILDGRMVVSEEIQIAIEGELVEQPQAAEAAGS